MDPLTYRAAGVDIRAGDEVVRRIGPLAASTLRPEVLGGLGAFAAFCRVPFGLQDPVLVSSTDGVGTKLKIAVMADRHDTIGLDLVAMGVNDVIVHGAEPLFFLDYLAVHKVEPEKIEAIVTGIAAGCRQAGCALVGGETAEMGGLYAPGEYDLAGFAVGAVEKRKIIDGSTIIPGDVVLGLASSGAHSNGYSLVRKIIDVAKPDLNADFHGQRLQDAIMAPTRIYVKPLLSLIETLPVKGMAHITGGGLTENVPRVLADNVTAVIQKDAWTLPPLFQWLQEQGRVADAEMHRVFNCGIGMTVIVSAENADAAVAQLTAAGETVSRIGKIRARAEGEHQTIVV